MKYMGAQLLCGEICIEISLIYLSHFLRLCLSLSLSLFLCLSLVLFMSLPLPLFLFIFFLLFPPSLACLLACHLSAIEPVLQWRHKSCPVCLDRVIPHLARLESAKQKGEAISCN